MPLMEELLTRSVLGAFYASYNKLGYGFVENVCVGGLMIELQRRGHRVEREVPIAVYYDGIIVGTYRVDLVVDSKLLIEVKAEARLAPKPRSDPRPFSVNPRDPRDVAAALNPLAGAAEHLDPVRLSAG